ncbi:MULTISPECIES: glycosyltransferase family 2 protein [unclassified Synechococcus]|uniref:glycosyltransferase family 2 protein n=1 Tax=unclassified Synechococcus TaxID=2626047 RepID=UPI0000690704|nr:MULTISPECIES: glycosyltransferase family 2 protein [unclassified Synechococcus]EAQ70104.1 glycosyltransferase (lgtD) [Synechococcus sp. RS9917]
MDVSIVITAYNYDRFIDECLDSCLGQQSTSLNHEVIVVDDGSTDNTSALLAQRSDPRLRVIRIKNSGIEFASNLGFAAASGRFIVRVDADDSLAPNYLARMEPMLGKDFGFYYTNYSIINASSETLAEVRLPEFDVAEIMTRGDFLATGTLYRAALLHSLGGYATQTRNSGLENYELILRLIDLGVKGVHLAESLFQYRRHSTNISASRKKRIIEYGRALFERNGLGVFCTNQYHPYKLDLSKDLS